MFISYFDVIVEDWYSKGHDISTVMQCMYISCENTIAERCLAASKHQTCDVQYSGPIFHAENCFLKSTTHTG